MANLPQLLHNILANGKVDTPELEILKRELYTDGKIDRQEADFLVELHKRVQRVSPAFEAFFYQAIKSHILADSRIDAEEASWLRQMIFADGKVDAREKQFLHELKGEARAVGPEFQALFDECMK